MGFLTERPFAASSAPGSIILWQATLVVDNPHLVRRCRGPLPEDDVQIALGCADCEARDDDTGASLVDEAPRKGPARRFNASGGQILPCAGEIIDVYPGSFTCGGFGQIENVFAIDGVRAKGQRLRLEYEALLRFEPRGLGAKRCN